MNPLTRYTLACTWLARTWSIGLLIIIFLLSSSSRPANAQGAGNALDLDASANEHLLIPHSPSLDISGSTLTVEAWIFPESYPEPFPTVMAKFNSASSWEFDVKNDNTVEWELFTTAQDVCNGGAIALGQWSHVAGTYDGTDLRVYVNGVEVAACPHGAPGPVGTNGQAVEIGSRLSGVGGFFDGRIDEARIWNVARSEAQLRDAMCRKLTGDETGLVAYYRLDEVNGTLTAADHTSNNNHAALTNMSGDEWEVSGAAIGDASVNDYAGTIELIDVLANPGSLTIDSFTGSPAGVHAYRVDEGPNIAAAPAGLHRLFEDQYFGVFVVGGSNPTYDLTLDYAAWESLTHEVDLDLARRDDNADPSWEDSGAAVDSGADTLALSGESGTEYIVGHAHAKGAGNALDLEAAASEHLLIPHSPSLDISGSAMTVEAWIFPESYPETYLTVMAKYNSASSWEFDVKEDNTVEWELFTTAQGVCNGGAVALGQWSHVAGTYDGTDLRVYVNGVEVAACPHGAPGPVGTNGLDVEVGSRVGGLGGFFDG